MPIKNNKKAKNKNNIINISTNDFINYYGIKLGNMEKYGDGWEDVVIERLLSEGIEVVFDEYSEKRF